MTRHQDAKGNSYARRARKNWLLSPAAGFGGDGEKVPCIHCSRLVTFADLDCDRIIPGALDGTYRRDNIQPSCARCNRSRQDRLDWVAPILQNA